MSLKVFHNLKSKLHLILLFILIIIASQLIFQNSKENIWSLCVKHVDHSKTHRHTMLKIYQDGDLIEIPKNLGITSNCMHPLHTHDNSGLIHMEYSKARKFYLGEFFDLMGIIFNDNQLGALKTIDGYKITVKSDGKIVKSNYRQLPLKDLGKIEINVNTKNIN